MKNIIITTTVVVLSAACATPRPPAELAEARTAYRDAEVDGARAAPSDLRDARLALARAESAYEEDPDSMQVRDLAYLAQRRAQLASMRAAVVVAHEERDVANAKLRALGAEAATDLREARRALSAADQRTLEAQRTARALKSELQDSAETAEELAARLEAEKEARHQSELKLIAALQAVNAAQAVREEPRGLVITLSGGVLFESGSSTLLGPAREALDSVAQALITVPGRSITIEGHTDSRGSRASNQTLSERRSEAVRAYLASRGVEEARLTAVGFGAEQPIADNDSPEGRANNRRVEIIVAPLEEPR